MLTGSVWASSYENIFESFQEEIFKCPLCKELYDLELRTQRVLPCMHFLCLVCLKNSLVMKSLQEPQCPTCQVSFSSTVLSPEDCRPNLPLLEILKNRAKAELGYGYCQEHACKQTLFCITDQVPICEGCHDDGIHKEHRVQLIKVLRDETHQKSIQLKKLLQENAKKKRRTAQEIDYKLVKVKELIMEKFAEMDKILQTKKTEVDQHLESMMRAESEVLNHAYEKNQTQLESKIAQISQEISQSEHGFLTKEDLIDNPNSSILAENNKLESIVTETEGTLNRFLDVLHSLKFGAMQRNEAFTQTVKEIPELLPTQRVERMPKLFHRIPQFKKMLRKNSPKNQEPIKVKTETESPLRSSAFKIFEGHDRNLQVFDPQMACDEMEEEFVEPRKHSEFTETEIQDMKNQIMEIETEPQLKLDFSNENISNEVFDNPYSGDFWNGTGKTNDLKANFSASSLTDQQFIKFVQNIMTPLESLTSVMINLAETKISYEGLQVFGQALEGFKLKSFVLNCSQTSIGTEGLKSLDEGLNSSIQTLENVEIIFDSTCIQGEIFLDVLSALEQSKYLKLSFENSQISSEIVSSIVFCLSFLAQSLESLDLNFNGTEIEDEGLESFSTHVVFHMERLRHFRLCLGGTFVSDDLLLDFFESLHPLTAQIETFELDLHSTGLTNVSFKHFCEAALSQMVNLEKLRLDLSQTKITDVSLKNMLIPIRRLKSLTLNLNENKLSDFGIKIFKENNNLENLETFNFHFKKAQINDRVLRSNPRYLRKERQNSKNLHFNSTLKKISLKPTPNSKNLLAIRKPSSEYSSDAENYPVSRDNFKLKYHTTIFRLDLSTKKRILLEIKKAVHIAHRLKPNPTLDFSELPQLIQGLELRKYTEILRQILAKNHPHPDSIPTNLNEWRKTIRRWVKSFSQTSLSDSEDPFKVSSEHNESLSRKRLSEKVFSTKWFQKYGRKISFRDKAIEILKNMTTKSWPTFYERILKFVQEFSNEYKNWEIPLAARHFWWYDFMCREKEVADLWKSLPLPREALKERYFQ